MNNNSKSTDQRQIVNAGKGSYLTGLYPEIALTANGGPPDAISTNHNQQIPKSCPINEGPQKTADCTKLVPTNQWFTPFAWQETWPRQDLGSKPTDPENSEPLYDAFTAGIFAEPIKAQAIPEGVSLLFPYYTDAPTWNKVSPDGADYTQDPQICSWSPTPPADPSICTQDGEYQFVRNQFYQAHPALAAAFPKRIANVVVGMVGNDQPLQFQSCQLAAFSDWAAEAVMQSAGGDTLRVTMLNGSPFAFFEYNKPGLAQVLFSPGVVAGKGSMGYSVQLAAGTTLADSCIVLKMSYLISAVPIVRYYALFGKAGSSWQQKDMPPPVPGIQNATMYANSNGGNYISVAVMPDNFDSLDAAGQQSLLQLFKSVAFVKITDTVVTPVYDAANQVVNTTYSHTFKALDGGNQTQTLFGLYPHHWHNQPTVKTYVHENTELTYRVGAGLIKLALGNSFTNTYAVPKLLRVLPKPTDSPQGFSSAVMAAYLKEITDNPSIYIANNSYYQGKDMAKWTLGSIMADTMGDADTAATLLTRVKQALENWFTATDASGKPKRGFPDGLNLGGVLYYDKNWSQLIPYPTDFGAARFGNDHIFHYGYWVRALAEIAHADPQWISDWLPMIELVIKDIANHDRKDSMFSFMKTFSLYQGMSYADGTARLQDGRNTESSSEAMNARSAVMLWVLATPQLEPADKSRINWAAFAYALEALTTNLYRFDAPQISFNDKSAYGKGYIPYMNSLFWSGKQEYNTFFSDFLSQKTPIISNGINWLPVSASSLYLRMFDGMLKRDLDGMVAASSKGSGGITPVTQWLGTWRMIQAMSGDNEYMSEAVTFVSPSNTSPADCMKKGPVDRQNCSLESIQTVPYNTQGVPNPMPDSYWLIDGGNSKANIYYTIWSLKEHIADL